MTTWKEGTVWDKEHPGALPPGHRWGEGGVSAADDRVGATPRPPGICTLIDSRTGLPIGQSRVGQGDRVAEAVEGARAALADAADTRTVCGPAMPRAEWAVAHRTRR
jgi:hypothetical protein